MANLGKHLALVLLVAMILMIYACHKDTPGSNSGTNTHIADSLRAEYRKHTDSAIGTYDCGRRHWDYGAMPSGQPVFIDTLLGDSVITISRLSDSTIQINNDRFVYKLAYGVYINGDPTLASFMLEAYPAVSFSHSYDSIIYVDKQSNYGGYNSYQYYCKGYKRH